MILTTAVRTFDAENRTFPMQETGLLDAGNRQKTHLLHCLIDRVPDPGQACEAVGAPRLILGL
jgi:hypothetical protein